MDPLRQRYGHAGGAPLGAQEFASALREQLQLQGRQVAIRVSPSWGPGKEDDVYVDFVNLPEGVGSAGGGAEAENNRMTFTVRGFGRDNAPPPSGKVKVDSIKAQVYRDAPGAPSRETRVSMRAKSGAPAAVAKYLADFLNRTVAEVPPRFTHTGKLSV